MTTERREWHAGEEELAAYESGRAHRALAASIEAHMLKCAECRAALARRTPDDETEAAWAMLADAIDRPSPTMLARLTGRHWFTRSVVATPALLQAALVRSAETMMAKDPQVRDRVIGELKDGLKLSAFTWHKPIAKDQVSAWREVILNIVGGPDETAFRVNGLSYDHNRIDATLPLGKAEEWRATSLTVNHPLHIHVNPLQIISIKDHEGRDMTDPKGPAFDPDYAGLKGEWKDTVMIKENVRVAFRTRYERFTGDFVIHCHIMFHGDHGMMQNLRIAAEGEPDRPFGLIAH